MEKWDSFGSESNNSQIIVMSARLCDSQTVSWLCELWEQLQRWQQHFSWSTGCYRPPHSLFVFLLIVMCADSWHFTGVLIMRIVWRQLEKTTCFQCTALTRVIDLIFFPSLLFLVPPILRFLFFSLNTFISIQPDLNFSFHLPDPVFFSLWPLHPCMNQSSLSLLSSCL